MLTETQRQAHFIDQVLRLQDEVLSGKHPRIKLPPDVIAQYARQQATQSQAQPSPIARLPDGDNPPRLVAHSNGISPKMPSQVHTNGHAGAVNSAATFHLPGGNSASGERPAPTSNIDPIVKQTSEVTSKVDPQVQRKHIEQLLKEQYEAQKQLNKGDKDGTIDTHASFAVSECLEQALQLVHHVSGFKSDADRSSSGSDTMHTNSYYSSQDNWSSQGSQPSAKGASTDQQHPRNLSNDPAATATKQQQLPQGEALSYDITTTRLSLWPSQQAHSQLLEFSSLFSSEASEDTEEGERDESEEYEPPAADELGTAAPTQPMTGMQLRGNHHVSPPLHARSVVQNHIETPFAPQPERVSPLALPNLPQVGQVQHNEPGHLPSPRIMQQATRNHIQNRSAQRISPRREQVQEDSSGSAHGKKRSPHNDGKDGQGSKKRKERKNKRRRGDVTEEPHRRTSGRRQPRSPEDFEPLIKEEPMSPPLGTLSDLPIARRRQPLLIDDDVEMLSPRRTDAFYVRDRPASQITPRHEINWPESPSTPQSSSRGPHRRITERDDQDLRRVASLQHARRPYSPQARTAYEESRLYAPSQAYLERPVHQEESTRPPPHLQQAQRVFSPAPVYIDEDYAVPPLVRRVQATPAATPSSSRPDVVFDQYGNKYYAAPPEPAYQPGRASAAPVSGRRPEFDRYERAVTRVPARMLDPYEEDDDFVRTSARMAPPPTTVRYFVDEQGREVESERIPNREIEMQDSPRWYREQHAPAQPPSERERAYSVRPREEERVVTDRLHERMEMAPPASIPRRQSIVHNEPGPLPSQPPQAYTLTQPTPRAQRSFSVRPGVGALGEGEYMAPPPPPSTMRASVQPQVRPPEREYLVRDPAPRAYRAVSVVHESPRRGEEWVMAPPPAQRRYQQYVGVEGEAGVPRAQSGRKDYVDDPMQGVEDGYNGASGRRVEYRY